MKKLLFLLLIFPGLIACSRNKGGQFEEPMVVDEIMADYKAEAAPALRSTVQLNEPAAAALSQTKKLIKNGSMEFETNNLAGASAAVNQLVKRFGGYVSDETHSNYNNTSTSNITVRVPAASFDSLLNSLQKDKSVRRITNTSVSIEDVTTQYIDAETRLNIKKEAYKKLNALFEQAKNLSETLEIQKQLTDLQAEIESFEGQLKYLNNQINFSTLRLTITTKDEVRANGFFRDVIDGLANGWKIFLKVVLFLVNSWLILLVAAGIFWFVRYRRKKKKINS